ncbi:hypothetical protein MPC4_20021 [Methylocella tundrae]|uniref:Transposase zinc-ribbon domain-containing protein n=1 Tax=Methylocella tundrae TaxID=227605 RepID=A0A8B6M463_METTU|nr:hypothetical protein MPC1_4350005 [Methylocella tundrae]VTZ49811.1 hypothetical protein MPC4_20021 [Methylocella tundrae]
MDYPVRQFFAEFSDDDACLKRVMEVRYGLRPTCGKCGVVDVTFHKISGRRAYACAAWRSRLSLRRNDLSG